MNKSKNPKPTATPTVTVPVAPQTKRYDEAFKRQAVENWIQTGTQIAAELDVSYPSLKDWKPRYWGDATPQRADLEAENRALKAELAQVREQRDILKKRWHLQRTLQARYQTVERGSAVLDVTRSGYHAWLQAGAGRHEQTDARLRPRIQELHRLHKSRFGAPRSPRIAPSNSITSPTMSMNVPTLRGRNRKSAMNFWTTCSLGLTRPKHNF